MRIIAFITDAASIERILEYIGEPPRPPPIAPAPMPDWDRLKPPAPDVEPLCELDQRVAC